MEWLHRVTFKSPFHHSSTLKAMSSFVRFQYLTGEDMIVPGIMVEQFRDGKYGPAHDPDRTGE